VEHPLVTGVVKAAALELGHGAGAQDRLVEAGGRFHQRTVCRRPASLVVVLKLDGLHMVRG